MNDLKIIISGTAGTGKSTMLLFLEKVLKENGFTVELDTRGEEDYDYGNEEHFRERVGFNYNIKLDYVKSNTKITLKSYQTCFDLIKTKNTSIGMSELTATITGGDSTPLGFTRGEE
jgi:ABC-type lipoprotein export system ATPase subunit